MEFLIFHVQLKAVLLFKILILIIKLKTDSEAAVSNIHFKYLLEIIGEFEVIIHTTQVQEELDFRTSITETYPINETTNELHSTNSRHFTPFVSLMRCRMEYCSIPSITVLYAGKQYHFQWLGNAVSENEALRIASSFLSESNKTLSLSSDVYFAFRHTQTQKVIIFEAFSVLPITNVIFQIVSDADNFSWNLILEKVTRRRNFQGVVLTTLLVIDPTINMDEVIRLNVLDFMFAAEVFNFSLRITPADGWMKLLPNNTLGGLGRQLLNREADISVQSQEIIPYRIKHLAYIMTDILLPVSAMFQQPHASFYRDIFIQSFDGIAWLYFTLTWTAIVVSLWLLTFLTTRFCQHSKIENGDLDDDTFCNNSLLLGIGMLTQQGYYYSSFQSNAIRIAVVCSLLIGTVSYMFYSASTFSMLKTEKPPIQTRDDLLKSGFSIYGDQNLANKALLQSYRPVADNLPTAEGVKMAMNGSNIFISFMTHVFHTAFDNNMTSFQVIYCTKFSQIKLDYGLRSHSGPYTLKDSQYLETFRNLFVLKQERGITQRNFRIYASDKTIFCSQQQKDQTPLVIRDIISAHFLLGVGIGCSFLILLLEIFLRNTPGRRLRRYLIA